MAKKQIEVDGVPVLLDEDEALNIAEPRPSSGRDAPLSKLGSRQKQALQNLSDMGGSLTTANKKKAALDAGYSDKPSVAVRAMDRILARTDILEAIEKKGGTADKVAEVIVDALDANHPLAKEEKPDHFARLKASQEVNKIKGIYPSTKVEVEEKIAVLHLDRNDAIALSKFKRLTGENKDPF